MGTNYYAELPQCSHPCAHCGADDRLHIGKSMVMFEAHDSTPWGPIESWADWRNAIRNHHISVIDEYGDTWNAEEFIAAVEATDLSRRRSQYQWLVNHQYSLDGTGSTMTDSRSQGRSSHDYRDPEH